MKGPIYGKPADLLETGERSKGNNPVINKVILMFSIFVEHSSLLFTLNRHVSLQHATGRKIAIVS